MIVKPNKNTWSIVCCLQETYFKDTSKLKVKGWKMLHHANSSDQKARISMLISDKIDFKHKRLSFSTYFPCGSDSKVSAYNAGGPAFDPWVGKVLWRRKWQPTPVLLPGKSHGWKSMVGYSPRGRKESDMTEWLHLVTWSRDKEGYDEKVIH